MNGTVRVFSAFAVLGLTLSGCSVAQPGRAVPVAPPQTSVTTPQTVVVQPPVTVTRPQTTVETQPNLTQCQRLYTEGYSYIYTYNAWASAGYPSSWDADHDGFPCEQSYGNQN
jgi:hypothetical protein